MEILCTTLSSAEAEYMAASLTAQKCLDTRTVESWMGNDNPIDNKNSIRLVLQTASHHRTEHVNVRHMYNQKI